MDGWIEQKYGYVPGSSKVNSKVAPLDNAMSHKASPEVTV
jgi:hypothetical protein